MSFLFSLRGYRESSTNILRVGCRDCFAEIFYLLSIKVGMVSQFGTRSRKDDSGLDLLVLDLLCLTCFYKHLKGESITRAIMVKYGEKSS